MYWDGGHVTPTLHPPSQRAGPSNKHLTAPAGVFNASYESPARGDCVGPCGFDGGWCWKSTLQYVFS